MTKVEEQIQDLLMATVRMEAAQENTTENVNKLVKIAENDMCTKGHCKDLSLRMEKAEEKLEAIESLPNKILWRVGLAVIAISATAVLSNFIIAKNATKKDVTIVKELEATIKKLETNQIRNFERYKLEKEYKVKIIK